MGTPDAATPPAGDAGTPPTPPLAPGASDEPPEAATPGPTDLAKHKYSKIIKMDTTAAGAGVAADVPNFPVAVVLTEMNFDFAGQAQRRGRSLR